MGFTFHVGMFRGVTILQRMHCRGITCHCFFANVPQVVICPVPAVVVDLLVVLRPYWGVDSLDGLVHSLIRGGVADSTLRSYAAVRGAIWTSVFGLASAPYLYVR